MNYQSENNLKTELVFCKIGALVTFCVVIVAIGIFIYQCAGWLRDGYWTAIPIGNYIPQNPNMNWEGMRGVLKIWEIFLGLPACMVIFIAGMWPLGSFLNSISRTQQKLDAQRRSR
jgi:hypothetical protein